jgi:uncharacterized protein (TIGR03546 family)
VSSIDFILVLGTMKSRTPKKKNTPAKNQPLADRVRAAYTRFLKMRGEPREIALGVALGIMVGMSPFLGFHTVLAVFLAALFKWNKLTAALAVFVTNPFTAPVIYPVTYMVGKNVLGVSNNLPDMEKFLSLSSAVELIKHSPMILADLTVGGIVVGLPLSIIAYWLALKTIENYRQRIKPKLAEKRQARKAGKRSRRRRKK